MTEPDPRLEKARDDGVIEGASMVLRNVRELLLGQEGTSALSGILNDRYQEVKELIRRLREVAKQSGRL